MKSAINRAVLLQAHNGSVCQAIERPEITTNDNLAIGLQGHSVDPISERHRVHVRCRSGVKSNIERPVRGQSGYAISGHVSDAGERPCDYDFAIRLDQDRFNGSVGTLPRVKSQIDRTGLSESPSG